MNKGTASDNNKSIRSCLVELNTVLDGTQARDRDQIQLRTQQEINVKLGINLTINDILMRINSMVLSAEREEERESPS